MASIRSVETKLVVFDTAVVDLTELLDDPVEVLFSTQLGGGTDINRGGLLPDPRRTTDTIYVLLARVSLLLASGVTVIALLALSDKGGPSFDHELAAKLAALGAPAFACTPDQFPGLMAAAIEKRDVGRWAAEQGIALGRPKESCGSLVQSAT